MGLSGIGIWQLLIVLVIVLLLFGTKRLKGLGGDLGGAIKGFKKAMTDENKSGQDGATEETLDAQATSKVEDNSEAPLDAASESKKETSNTESKS